MSENINEPILKSDKDIETVLDKEINTTDNSGITDESMEELKIDDDEDVQNELQCEAGTGKTPLAKDDSIEEDLLGTQSLLISESEDDEVSPVQLKRHKVNQIIESDEENAEQETPQRGDTSLNDLTTQKPKKTKKISNLMDSESDDETSEGQNPTNNNEKLTNNKEKKFSALIDSESEDELEKLPTNSKKANSKLSGIVDSDSEQSVGEDQTNASDEENQVLSEEHDSKATKKKKVQRASAKKAIDEIQAIQSEQQRLHREAHISIPYHKPKRHTLQEFLNRRTLAKPLLQKDGGSPAAAVQSKNLKMSREELEEYAKLMEERAKEATAFFKSESDEDLEDIGEDNENAEQQINEEVEIETGAAVGNDDIPEDDIPSTSNVCSAILDVNYIDATTTPLGKNEHENIKRLIGEKNLTDSPSLKGDPNMLIDLETGNLIAPKPTGVDNLLKRFITSSVCRKAAKTSETMSILSTENGKLELTKVNVSITEDSNPNKEQKPGSAYLKLKENLRTLIANKRREDFKKKLSDTREEEKEYNKCCAIDNEDDGEQQEEEYDVDTNPEKQWNADDILIDDEENEIEPNTFEGDENYPTEENDENYPTEDNDEKDEEMDEETNNEIEATDMEDADDEDEDDEDDNDKQNEADDLEKEKNAKRKNRIIKAFQDDSDDETDFVTQQTVAEVSAANTSALFDEEHKRNVSEEESELLGLCSGRFTQATQKPLLSQIPITQINEGVEIDNVELMELCSGVFDSAADTQPRTLDEPKLNSLPSATLKSNKILSSDEELSLAAKDEDSNRAKKLSKKSKKRKAKLGFSDDEDETPTTGDDSGSEEDDIPQTFVDYDSEENEIEVQLTKKDFKKKAGHFLENEAELSESEWGSADEDEQNMDKYDIELGDEDEYDQNKLQREVGQIHMRKVLDEDIREVKKIQEMLFDDEETDGVGRQRQFRWKNVENGFNLEDPNGSAVDAENNESGDEDNEQQWRKMRHERELLLQQKNPDESSENMNSQLLTKSIGDSTSFAKKLNIITSNTNKSMEAKKDSPFLISKNSTANKKATRGSFLVRDKEILTKLAGLTKTGTADSMETAGSVQVKSVKPQNFVFATLTEEEHAKLKRKSEDLQNVNENGYNFMKKPKFEPRRQKCLIDHLL